MNSLLIISRGAGYSYEPGVSSWLAGFCCMGLPVHWSKGLLVTQSNTKSFLSLQPLNGIDLGHTLVSAESRALGKRKVFFIISP